MFRPQHLHALAVQTVHTATYVLGLNGQLPSKRRSIKTANSTVSGRPWANNASMAARMVRPVNSTSSTMTTFRFFDRKIKLGHSCTERLSLRLKSSLKNVMSKSPERGAYLQEFLQSCRPIAQPSECPWAGFQSRHFGEISVLLDQLMGQTIKRQPKLKWVDEEFRGTHNAAQK